MTISEAQRILSKAADGFKIPNEECRIAFLKGCLLGLYLGSQISYEVFITLYTEYHFGVVPQRIQEIATERNDTLPTSNPAP